MTIEDRQTIKDLRAQLAESEEKRKTTKRKLSLSRKETITVRRAKNIEIRELTERIHALKSTAPPTAVRGDNATAIEMQRLRVNLNNALKRADIAESYSYSADRMSELAERLKVQVRDLTRENGKLEKAAKHWRRYVIMHKLEEAGS